MSSASLQRREVIMGEGPDREEVMTVPMEAPEVGGWAGPGPAGCECVNTLPTGGHAGDSSGMSDASPVLFLKCQDKN